MELNSTTNLSPDTVYVLDLARTPEERETVQKYLAVKVSISGEEALLRPRALVPRDAVLVRDEHGHIVGCRFVGGG